MGEKKEIILKAVCSPAAVLNLEKNKWKQEAQGGLILILLHWCNSSGFSELLHEKEEQQPT